MSTWGDLDRIANDVFGGFGEGQGRRGRVWDLAPQDENFWATVTYTALAHMRQNRPRTPHPDDALNAPVVFPGELQNPPPSTQSAVGEGPPRLLVNRDRHLRRIAGNSIGAIPPYLHALLRPEFDAILAGPPSRYVTNDVFLCPHPDCDRFEPLERLSERAVEVVRAHIPEPQPDPSGAMPADILEVHPHVFGDNIAAKPAYYSLVADLVGLDHWEREHLGPAAGLRCIIHGQDRLHRLNYEWEDSNLLAVLTARTAYGVAARAFEETKRLQIQRSISILARRWAIATEHAAHRLRREDREAAHTHAHDLAVEMLREERARDHPRGLSIWRQAREIHERVFAVADVDAGAQQDTMIVRAREVMRYWTRGDGEVKLEERPNDPRLHMPLPM